MSDAALAPVNELAGRGRLGIGANQPPLAEMLAEEIAPYTKRAEALMQSAGEAQIASDDEAAKVTALIKLLRDHEQTIDEAREARKKPFLEAGRLVDSVFGTVIRRLKLARCGDNGKGGLTGMLTAYERRREEAAAAERRRIEEEQRKAEEEAAAARAKLEAAQNNGSGSIQAELAAIAAQEEAERLARKAETIRPEPIRTTVGNSSMRREIAFEITDLRKALGWLVKNRNSEIMQAARAIVGKHLNSLGVDAVERGVEIPGVAARIEKRAQVR